MFDAVNCLYPGVIDTNLLRTARGPLGDDPKKAAKNILTIAFNPKYDYTTGFFFDQKKINFFQRLLFIIVINKKITLIYE